MPNEKIEVGCSKRKIRMKRVLQFVLIGPIIGFVVWLLIEVCFFIISDNKTLPDDLARSFQSVWLILLLGYFVGLVLAVLVGTAACFFKNFSLINNIFLVFISLVFLFVVSFFTAPFIFKELLIPSAVSTIALNYFTTKKHNDKKEASI
ncbi:MAG: hypothetical protein LWW76_05045 [Burkholderiales bacterium]|nr:hypothetical protein [Burkholderiales bacterium]